MNNLIGKKIRQARQRLRLTQDIVADHLNVDRTAVVKWESQRPEQFVHPERDRLVALAQLTRTPLAWFVDGEESPIPDLEDGPGPEIKGRSEIAKINLAQRARRFWDDVKLGLKEQRSDLWSRSTYDPLLPEWQRPLAPDILTERSAVALISLPRPYYYTHTQVFANLVAFERSSRRQYRLAVLDWAINPGESGLPSSDREMLPRFSELRGRLHDLAERLQVTYVVVHSKEEAVEYLRQLL